MTATPTRLRIALIAVSLAGALALTSCGEAPEPVAPPGPSADLFAPDVNLLGGLLTCSPLPYDSVTEVIGHEGGTIAVGPHSFTVPYGALSSDVAITAIVPANSTTNIVRFKPDGLLFEKKASLRISYANCGGLGILSKRIVQVGGDLQILDFLQTSDDLFGQAATGKVKHFSDYAVAW